MAKWKRLRTADWGWEDSSKGPWFLARFESEMSCCGDKCSEDDEIRADGQGGYEGRCCYPDGEDD